MNKILFIIVLILAVGGGYVLLKGKAPANEEKTEPVKEAVIEKGVVKEFAVSGNEFAFVPKTLTAVKGDTVKVTFTNTGKLPHNFVIKELNVQGKTIQPGQTDTVTFTADKAGSFEYYCSVGTHKDKGMVGMLTVE